MARFCVSDVECQYTHDVGCADHRPDGQAAVFQIIGAAKNSNGVTTLIGTTGNAFTRKDDATWIGDIVAGPNGVVFIQVKGAAASGVRWVANVRTVEVTM
jgi:hypothetical protein